MRRREQERAAEEGRDAACVRYAKRNAIAGMRQENRQPGDRRVRQAAAQCLQEVVCAVCSAEVARSEVENARGRRCE